MIQFKLYIVWICTCSVLFESGGSILDFDDEVGRFGVDTAGKNYLGGKGVSGLIQEWKITSAPADRKKRLPVVLCFFTESELGVHKSRMPTFSYPACSRNQPVIEQHPELSAARAVDPQPARRYSQWAGCLPQAASARC